jgi:hypothetical protein
MEHSRAAQPEAQEPWPKDDSGHYMHCNGDRKFAPGVPGHSCYCPPAQPTQDTMVEQMLEAWRNWPGDNGPDKAMTAALAVAEPELRRKHAEEMLGKPDNDEIADAAQAISINDVPIFVRHICERLIADRLKSFTAPPSVPEPEAEGFDRWFLEESDYGPNSDVHFLLRKAWVASRLEKGTVK